MIYNPGEVSPLLGCSILRVRPKYLVAEERQSRRPGNSRVEVTRKQGVHNRAASVLEQLYRLKSSKHLLHVTPSTRHQIQPAATKTS